MELVRQKRDTSAWGKGCLPDSECLVRELGCSLLASAGVVHILRAAVGKPSWEEAGEDRAGSFLVKATIALFAWRRIWVFLGLVASRYLVGFLAKPS